MQTYFALICAVIAEVFGDSMMKLSEGFKRKLPLIGVLAGYGLSFYLLAQVMNHMSLGVSYAVWNGLGIVLTMIVGVVVWKELCTPKKLLGMLMILSGVVILHLQQGA